jgi:hypothetical protein
MWSRVGHNSDLLEHLNWLVGLTVYQYKTRKEGTNMPEVVVWRKPLTENERHLLIYMGAKEEWL